MRYHPRHMKAVGNQNSVWKITPHQTAKGLTQVDTNHLQLLPAFQSGEKIFQIRGRFARDNIKHPAVAQITEGGGKLRLFMEGVCEHTEQFCLKAAR